TSEAPDTSTPAGILRLGNAFCDAKALLIAVELDLFTALHNDPATEEQVRQRLGLHGRGLSDFLNLLVALGLLRRTNGGYGNAAGADGYLVRGERSYVGGFLERSNRNLYPAWGRLAQALRTGEQQSGSDFTKVLNNPAVLAQFVDMMDALTNMVGPPLIDSFDWPDSGTVLDVGGARGNLAAQVVKAQPQLTGIVFDLPQMTPLFDEMISQYGLTGTVQFHGGDFFTDELPPADVVIMGHVLHDWNPDQRRILVAKAFRAVSPGGALLAYDRMLDDQPDHVENLVISLDMLLVTEGGSEYPVNELRTNAQNTGFTSITDQPLGDYDTLMICHKST
ncbi:MAG: methyltransferase, partial [Pseudonocardiaceae bacterium]